MMDWGGGLIYVQMPESADGGAGAIRNELRAIGGHATLIRGSFHLRSSVPVFEPQDARIAQLSEAIRKKFDPNRILNPARMVA